ncbi:MAG: hypothetical protein JF592_18375 [Microbacterium sp.]|uniref:hypothetical protein n=1 Tax=Microbacterium sp. TaxID=51671 RepID=UPI001DB562CF|nr:hypothetical protein [Microbacterium sp.]MBW8764515.1 hypothetical protein [Microbacterium sp.]
MIGGVESRLPLRTNLLATDYAEIVSLAQEGKGGDLVADIVHDWLLARRQAGAPAGRRLRRLTDREKLQIAERAKAGATPDGLSFVYGVTPETIRKHLRYLLPAEKTNTKRSA